MKRSMALASLALLTLLIAACTSGGNQGRTSSEPPIYGHQGRLFGAYVSPHEFTQEGRIQALLEFEDLLGQELDVVNNFYSWELPFPREFDDFVLNRGSTLMLSWAGTSPKSILSGHHDSLIRDRARSLAARPGRIMLRWRWEMNRPNLQQEIGSSHDYVAAWKHIRALFRDEGAENIEWLWCPSANNFLGTRGAEFFPGEEQVDWLCADAYTGTPEEPLETVLAPFLHWAANHKLPIIIGEFGTHEGAPGARSQWLADVRKYLATQPQVRGIVYFESANAPTGRYDLSDEPSALAAFRSWVSAESDRADRPSHPQR